MSLVLGVLYWRMKVDRRAVTYVNSQGETAPACSSGKPGKHILHPLGDPRATSSRKPESHLSDGAPHLVFSCVSLASTSHIHIHFSNSSTPEGSLLCPLQVGLPGTRATPSLSQMIPCLQDTQSSAEQTGLNPQASFQRDIAKIFMRSSVWRQEENVGNRSSLFQKLPVVWS